MVNNTGNTAARNLNAQPEGCAVESSPVLPRTLRGGGI